MKSNDTVYLTKEGLEKLKAELTELKEVKLPEIAQQIKVARDMGDISENSMYDAAMEEKSFIEGKVAELENILKLAKVAEEGPADEIRVGSKVILHIDGDDEEFHIVGAPEADPLERRISHESPLGSALMGKKVGDKITVEAPVGELSYTVLKIK